MRNLELLRQNHARTQPNGVQCAEKAGVFDFRTAILDSRQTGCLGAPGCFIVVDAQLEPEDFASASVA